MNCTITFEDHGQDFLEWDIKDSVVTESRFQAFWVGARVFRNKSFRVGGYATILTTLGDKFPIKYPITKIVFEEPPFGFDVTIELADGRAKRVTKLTPLTEKQWCAAYGDPRIKSDRARR